MSEPDHNEAFLYVGIDAHQDTLAVAVLPERAETPEPIVTLPNRAPTLRRWFRRLADRAPATAVYEAGCLGFSLQRLIEKAGVPCLVAAPSHLPKLPGDHRKTDRIDARRLASFLRAGQIVAVTPPSRETEALRGLTRARQSLREDVVRQKHRILKFLGIRGFVYREGMRWTAKHLRWLRDLDLGLDDDRDTLDFLLDEYEQRANALALLDQRIERRAQRPDVEERVRSLLAFRGIRTLTALSVIAELGDPRRFPNARKVSAYCGITPSEYSSGMRIKRGPITRSGNARLRRLLVEAVQHYARPYPPNSTVLARRARAPKHARSLAQEADRRLRRRYRLLARRKHTNVAKTAVARELIGFLWAALVGLETRAKTPES
ncbi:MAG: IS110 family transposase [Caldilineae bacterium]|nr:MAG: IS110 family transposase [Caldilineae bacterium]